MHQAVTAAPSPLVEIERALGELEANVAIVGHIVNSGDAIAPGTWGALEGRLMATHRSLADLWKAAWDQREADRREWETALAAAAAQRAAPGSTDDIEDAEACWRLLAAAAETVLGAVAARATARVGTSEGEIR